MGWPLFLTSTSERRQHCRWHSRGSGTGRYSTGTPANTSSHPSQDNVILAVTGTTLRGSPQMNLARDFILYFLPMKSVFSGSLPSAGNTQTAPGVSSSSRKPVGDVQRTLLHSCQLSPSSLTFGNKNEMTRDLVPREGGSDTRGRQGRDCKAAIAPSTSNLQPPQDHTCDSKIRQCWGFRTASTSATAAKVCWDVGSWACQGLGSPSRNLCCCDAAQSSSGEGMLQPPFSQTHQLTRPSSLRPGVRHSNIPAGS